MILLSVVSSHHLANHSSLSTEGDHSMEEELREADAMEEKDCGKARALLTLFGFRLLTHHLFLCFHART